MCDCGGSFVPASFTGDSGGGSSGVTILDEGVAIPGNPHFILNFVGGNITATDAGGGQANITVAVVAGIDIRDEGVAIPGNPHTVLNFIGAGVTAADAGAGVANVTIPGGVTLQDEGVAVPNNPHLTMNFVGGGVTVTDVAGVGTVTIPGASAAVGLQAFRYTVTGGEASLSDFMVNLPVARANDTYRAQATLAGVAAIVGIDLPDIAAGDRTTTQLRFVSSAAMTAGDQIDFLITDVV